MTLAFNFNQLQLVEHKGSTGLSQYQKGPRVLRHTLGCWVLYLVCGFASGRRFL